MGTQVVCQECCKQVEEEESVCVEDGRTLCAGCASEEVEEEGAEHHASAGECGEGAGVEGTRNSVDRELRAGPTVCSDWVCEG